MSNAETTRSTVSGRRADGEGRRRGSRQRLPGTCSKPPWLRPSPATRSACWQQVPPTIGRTLPVCSSHSSAATCTSTPIPAVGRRNIGENQRVAVCTWSRSIPRCRRSQSACKAPRRCCRTTTPCRLALWTGVVQLCGWGIEALTWNEARDSPASTSRPAGVIEEDREGNDRRAGDGAIGKAGGGSEQIALGSVLVERSPSASVGPTLRSRTALWWAPPGGDRLILGHESLGRVIDPGPSGFAVGEHVVGVVRRPDPAPCPNAPWVNGTCAPTVATPSGASSRSTGSWPSAGALNRTTRCGWTRTSGSWGYSWNPPRWLPRRGSTSLPSVGARSGTRTVFVVGAGPIGLLAAMIGVQLGVDVHVLDRATSGPQTGAGQAAGRTYHTGAITDTGLRPHIVVESTGVPN